MCTKIMWGCMAGKYPSKCPNACIRLVVKNQGEKKKSKIGANCLKYIISTCKLFTNNSISF